MLCDILPVCCCVLVSDYASFRGAHTLLLYLAVARGLPAPPQEACHHVWGRVCGLGACSMGSCSMPPCPLEPAAQQHGAFMSLLNVILTCKLVAGWVHCQCSVPGGGEGRGAFCSKAQAMPPRTEALICIRACLP